MMNRNNPFEYDAANNLSEGMVLDYYIEDFNYSRFIQTNRNVFLVGERGCGKTMTLLYNAWSVQSLKAQRESKTPDLSLVGVYVPCNTPLTHKTEYQLLGDFPASVISEHFLVLSITLAIARTLASIPDVMKGADEAALRSEVQFILGAELPQTASFFDAIQQFIQRVLMQTQRALNNPNPSAFYEDTYSFSSVVVPILSATRRIPALKSSHFMLMIDDAQALNDFQIKALNSWIAYRDHSLFSFKVAIAKIGRRFLITASGGSILEGHDYLQVDMEQPFQNEKSDFGRLAERLLARRLEQFQISATPEAFFPISKSFQDALDEAEREVRKEAVAKYGSNATRKISDYVYKYKRAYFFRNRPAKANRPEYSSFTTIVFISTGVIRNLLQPCYWMYDKVLSLQADSNQSGQMIEVIPPHVQSEVLLERSKKLWDRLRDGLDQDIEGCSRDDATAAFRLMDNLAAHFRERLLKHKSEPTANSFTISGITNGIDSRLDTLLEVLRKAQLIYTRSGSAKDHGKREIYYVPNRLLWPDRGLDPHGQHARVSISMIDLCNAAFANTPIPFGNENETDQQEGFWDE